MHSEINKQDIYLVIMAGGIGSRFWPISTPDCPKQFQDVLGIGRTLFQDTLHRFKDIVPMNNVLVVTSQQYAGFVQEQEPEIPDNNILGEPFRRNTAPCLAYAAYTIQKRNPNACMIVTPSDHYVSQTNTFQEIIRRGLTWLKSEGQDALMTMGIKPDRPETGYGYIQTSGFKDQDIVPVLQFKEKPDVHTAIEYIQSGEYLWNSGIFMWKNSSIIKAFEKHLPTVHSLFSQLKPDHDSINHLNDTYEKSPDISIDYGILERADNIFVISAECGWSDLGTWGSLWQQERHDDSGNSLTSGKTRLYNTKNCVIRIPSGKEVIIEGLEDFIVVDDEKHLLIFRKENEQLIGTYSKQLSQ
jgi:mannose-1-phosphate guanylyltransferase